MTITKAVTIGVLALIALSVLLFGLNAAGIWGGTVVQREVFESSYQRDAGLKGQLATDQAAVASMKSRLSQSNLDPTTRSNLEAQLRAAEIRIATTKEQMND